MVRRIITCRIDKYLWLCVFDTGKKEARTQRTKPTTNIGPRTTTATSMKNSYSVCQTHRANIHCILTGPIFCARFTLIDTSSPTENEWIFSFFFRFVAVVAIVLSSPAPSMSLSFPFSFFLCFVVSRPHSPKNRAHSILAVLRVMMACGMLYGFFVCVSGNRNGTRKQNAHRRSILYT